IDPILFGTMVAVNLQAAFLSPPVAMSAFYLKGVSPRHVTLNQIFAGMMPYMFIVLICLVFMYIWPGMTLWLPEFLYGKYRGGLPPRLATRQVGGAAMSVITVQSKAHEQVIDVTQDVAALAASMRDGVCHLFTQHTTCALTILTNEAGIAEDLLTVLHGLVPQATAYVHDVADHVRAHALSALVGPSVSVPVRDGRIRLGQFQRI